MNSELLSALEGAEQHPSQGFKRCYPDYSQNTQDSSSGQSDEDMEIVDKTSYRLHISGNTTSTIPLSATHIESLSSTHIESQNYNRVNCVRSPKKLSPPIEHRQTVAVSQSQIAQPRHNGCVSLLNTNTPVSLSQQGSKIIFMTPQGQICQNRVSQNSIPRIGVPQNRIFQTSGHTQIRHQTYDPYIPSTVTQTPSQSTSISIGEGASFEETGGGRIQSSRGRGQGLPSRGQSLRGRGQSSTDQGQSSAGREKSLRSRGQPSRGRGRGRGQISRGRGQALRGNATGLNLTQYSTSQLPMQVCKGDLSEVKRTSELLLNDRDNSGMHLIQQAIAQQQRVQHPRTQQYVIPSNIPLQRPFTFVYKAGQTLLLDKCGTTVTLNPNIPIIRNIVNTAPVTTQATTKMEVISDSDSNSPAKNSTCCPPQVSHPMPVHTKRIVLTSTPPVMSSCRGRMKLASLKPAILSPSGTRTLITSSGTPTVMTSLVAHSEISSSGTRTVMSSPVSQTVMSSPVSPTVMSTLVTPTEISSPVTPTMMSSLVTSTMMSSPVTPTVMSSPATPKLISTPLTQAVMSTLVTSTEISSLVTPTMMSSPVTQTVMSSPHTSTVIFKKSVAGRQLSTNSAAGTKSVARRLSVTKSPGGKRLSAASAQALLLAVSKSSPQMKHSLVLPSQPTNQLPLSLLPSSLQLAPNHLSQSSQISLPSKLSSQSSSEPSAPSSSQPSSQSSSQLSLQSSLQSSPQSTNEEIVAEKTNPSKENENHEKPKRPESPEIPVEYDDKEGLCPNCGQWSAVLKKCDFCARSLWRNKCVKYRKKGDTDCVVFPPYKSMTDAKNTVDESPKEILASTSRNSKGVGTNKFYSKAFETHLEIYNTIPVKNDSLNVKTSCRGGGRGKRGRGTGRPRGRPPLKKPEPELISISSSDEDDDVDSITSAPIAATPTKHAIANSDSQQSSGSMDSSSDTEVCQTPPIKRKAKMRDQDGNSPSNTVLYTISPESAIQHNKILKKDLISSVPSSEEEVTQVPGVIPVLEPLEVCLLRFGSWTPSVINPVMFQTNCIMFNFRGDTESYPQLRLEAKDINLCQYNLQKGMPTIFIYTTPKFAMFVRERLKMTKGPNLPYFDPGSADESEKRVIIRPMSDPDQNQATRIIQTFHGMARCTNRLTSALFTELDKDTVNQLLVCSKPSEMVLVRTRSKFQKAQVSNVETNSSDDGSITVTARKKRTIVMIDPRTLNVTAMENAVVSGNTVLSGAYDTKENIAEDGDEAVIVRRFLGPCVTLFIYPPPPSTGGITVTSDDLACLDEGEFLNDVIIDFYLKYLMAQILSEEDKNRTHIFSSFFYKRLMQREYGRNVQNPELSAMEKRHNRVRKWTRNVDLFEKDFVIIPINESAHWFVAVICFPGLVATPEVQSRSNKYTDESEAADSPAPPDICSEAEASAVDPEEGHHQCPPVLTNQRVELDASSLPNATSGKQVEDDAEPMDIDEELEYKSMDVQESTISAITESTTAQTEVTAENNQAEDTQCPSVCGSQEESVPPSPAPSADNSDDGPTNCTQTKCYNQPCILIFDSLRGPCRRHVIQKLREYFAIEWQTRKKSNIVFDVSTMRGQIPEVPQQTNYSDCGVFVLQYVESFFACPIQRLRVPLRGLSNWFAEETANRKRGEIQTLIQGLKDEWKADGER